MIVYNGIKFGEGLKMTFAEFKKIVSHLKYFKSFSDEEREKEFKNAYKVATNGDIKTSTKKRKESKSTDTGEGDISDSQED